jgi:hypothetical protein
MATRTFHLIFGQSNARGAAQKVDLTDLRYDITQTDVRQYTRLDTVFGGTASAAMTIPSGSFSIEAAYGYHLRNDAGQLPLIFRDGWSGTSLAGSWQPEAAGGEWANALNAMWQCYEAAKTEFLGDDLVFGSLVWIQGEADVQNSTFATAYEANLVKLGNAFRGELGANLPIVFVQLSENCGVTPGSPGDLAVVRAAYVSAAATLGNCAVVDATPIALQVDNVHYTANGLMELGDDVFAAYATLAPGTQLARTGRAFDVVDSAHVFANSAQAAVGNRDENPANGGFGRRLGPGCRDPWPTTPRDLPLAHPYQNVWYVPIDSVMVADGTLDVTTDARPIDLAWSNLIPAAIPVPSYDHDAQAYFDRVEGPSGDNESLEPEVKTAINDFVVGCKADGIWTAIKASCILAGARTLSGALQPLVGTAPTNFNFVSGNYSRKTGLVGDGTTKYLSSNRANNADPQNDNHGAFYVTGAPTSGLRFFMGSDAGPTTGANNFLQNTDGSLYVRNRSVTYSNTFVSALILGFKAFSRNNSANYTLRDNATTSVISRVSETPSASVVQIFDRGTTPPHSPTDARLSFYSIGEDLDLELLESRVSTLMTDLDAAITEWSPTDLSSLTLSFDENGMSGSIIEQWDDQAGVIGDGAYFYQANSSFRPRTNTINGVTVASFTSYFMRSLKLPGAVTLPLSDAISASGYHVFAIASVNALASNVTSTIGYQLPGIITDLTANWYPFNFRYIDATTVEVVGGHWVGSDVTVSAGNIAVNTPVLLEAWYDGTDFRIQVNGNTPGSAAAGNVASLTSQINIGSNYTRSQYFRGLASDIIICNAPLSAGDRASARTYLANKYGITI